LQGVHLQLLYRIYNTQIKMEDGIKKKNRA